MCLDALGVILSNSLLHKLVTDLLHPGVAASNGCRSLMIRTADHPVYSVHPGATGTFCPGQANDNLPPATPQCGPLIDTPLVKEHTPQHGLYGSLRRTNRRMERTNMSYTGGLGERYCSQKCYDAGGATVTSHLLQNWRGDCSVCRGPVSLRIGSPASMVCWKPGLFLFHCGSPSCVDAVKRHVRQTDVCAVCGAPV